MESLRFGETKVLKLQRRSIDTLTLECNAVHTTANTAFTSQETFLTNNIKLKIVLTRKGQKTTILNDILKPFLQASNYANSSYDILLSSGIQKVAHASGVKAVHIIPIAFNFGIINLKDDDVLDVEINIPLSACTSQVDTSASSITVDFIDAIGYEVATPVHTLENIAPSESNKSLSIGDFITSVFFINTDKNTSLSADEVLSNVVITSDRYNKDLNLRQLESLRLQQFQTLIATNRFNSFSLLPDSVSKCSMNLTLNGSNVVGNNNFVVIKKNIPTTETVSRYIDMSNRHQQELVQSI